MAIVNTFERCLESPYLSEDAGARARVGPLLATAADRLEAAANLHQGGLPADGADVVLLGYEAMFACLRALVYSRGYREAGLRCLLLACEALFVKTGDLDAALLHDFERAQRMRLSPEEALASASRFVRRTLELLKA